MSREDRAYSTRQFEPLNLEPQAVARYWRHFGGETVWSILNEMDSKDKWADATSRHAMVQEAINDLSLLIQNPDVADQDIKAYTRDLIFIFAYLKTSIVFRFLKWLEVERNPVLYAILEEVSSTDVSESETDEQGYMTAMALLKHRLLMFKKLHRLSNIFSLKRMARVEKWVNNFESNEYPKA